MKIVTYNVNGIRSAIRKGLLDWIEENDFDIICLQEVKAHSGSVPLLLFEGLGYCSVWHSARRKGYSGVATFFRIPPSRFYQGLGIEKFDVEGRVLRTDFDELTVLNCYFPNGKSGPERQKFKMQFLNDFQQWIEYLLEERSQVIVVGDYNIAHREIDIANPGRNENSSGFLPEERSWLDAWFAAGFVDAFRILHPETVSYTWWRATQFARRTGQGWRLDYQSVSDAIAPAIVRVKHLTDVEHSDHCPVVMEIELSS